MEKLNIVAEGYWERLDSGFIDIDIDDTATSFSYTIDDVPPWEGAGFIWRLWGGQEGNTLLAEGKCPHRELAVWESTAAAVEAAGRVPFTQMTPPQAERAWALASRHAHLWARAVTPGVVDIREIAMRAIPAQDPRLPGGLIFPHLDPLTGVITHTTGSERTRWEVDREGGVSLEVRRPLGAVLRAVVPPRGAVQVSRVNPEIPLHARHVRALEHVAGAIVPGFEVGDVGEVLPD